MEKKRKDFKLRCMLYVPCPIKLQRRMLKNLRATASNGRLFPERAKKARQILAALEKRKPVTTPTFIREVRHEDVKADTALSSPQITKKQTVNFWQYITNIIRKILLAFARHLSILRLKRAN